MKIDDEIVKAVLRMMFGYGDEVALYEIIDNDMLRKPAIDIKKRKVYENGDNEFVVKINWRLLDQAILLDRAINNSGGEEWKN